MNYIEFAEQGQRVYNRNVFPEPKVNLPKEAGQVNYRESRQWYLNKLINDYVNGKQKNKIQKDATNNTKVSSNIPIFDFSNPVGVADFSRSKPNQRNGWSLYSYSSTSSF